MATKRVHITEEVVRHVAETSCCVGHATARIYEELGKGIEAQDIKGMAVLEVTPNSGVTVHGESAGRGWTFGYAKAYAENYARIFSEPSTS